TRDLPVATAHPGPFTLHVERLAGSVAGRLRDPVETGRVVRERRAVPEEIARDVGARAEIREPVHAVRVQREVQPVRVAVAPAELPALEADVPAPAPPTGAQHGESLRLEQYAPRRPAGRIRRKLGG